MASDILHIKDTYYFEVPKALWPSKRESRKEFPEHIVRLSPGYQDWEAPHLYKSAAELVDGAPGEAEVLGDYLIWRNESDNFAKPFDRYLEEAKPEGAEGSWLEKFQESLSKPDFQAKWNSAKAEAEDLDAYFSETEEWSPATIKDYNKSLSGKILVPQPFGGKLKNNYEAESGFCISKFMVLELVAAILIAVFFIRLASRMRSGIRPKGRLWNLFEAVLLFIRDEMARPAIGKHDADKFVPLLWTIFLFVLCLNLFGMLPWVGAPTGAFGVTFGLACVVFGTVIVSGSIKFGVLGFWKNQVPSMGLPLYLAIPIVPALFLIEVLGLFIKHAVLSIRLLANMVAGHLVLLAVMGLAVAAAEASTGIWGLTATISVAGSAAFSCLELFVAFLQAYVFTFLSALFIGAAVHHH